MELKKLKYGSVGAPVLELHVLLEDGRPHGKRTTGGLICRTPPLAQTGHAGNNCPLSQHSFLGRRQENHVIGRERSWGLTAKAPPRV